MEDKAATSATTAIAFGLAAGLEAGFALGLVSELVAPELAFLEDREDMSICHCEHTRKAFGKRYAVFWLSLLDSFFLSIFLFHSSEHS